MENETPKGEPHKNKSRKKVKNKNKQATVLKQLNNQNLYPLQERIGIYVVAALSVLGIILIAYSGVMALVSNAENESYDTSTEVDVDVDEVTDMLDDLDDLLDDDGSENPDQNADQTLQGEDDNESSGSASDVTIGVINGNMVNLWREPENIDALLTLHEGDEVNIVDFDYNAYWAQVEVETDAIDGTSFLPGFILKEFIDIEE